MKICKNCGYQYSDSAFSCPSCGSTELQSKREATVKTEKLFPMKWYYFLIYFLLFASVVGNIITLVIEGFKFYALFAFNAENVFITDIVTVITCVLAIIYCLRARHALAKKKEKGPGLLFKLYTITLIGNFIVLLFSFFISKNENVVIVNWLSLFITVFGQVIMLAVNMVYFKKREHIFKN